MESNMNNKNVINKKYIKENWYARIIEFLNKATYNETSKMWSAYRNDLLQWNNWREKKLSYKPPALIKLGRSASGKIFYGIHNDLLQKAISFWKETYESKWITK